jgi:multicomponent Na+:H+ antiporter subunit B
VNSVIVRTVTRGLLPALLLYSFFLLTAGHNAPGGGFVGGLVAASAFALYSLAYGVETAREALRIDSRTLIGLGLTVAIGSGIVPLVQGLPFMTGLWTEITLPVFGTLALGTPVFFDVGVYLLVVGVTLTILLPLREE